MDSPDIRNNLKKMLTNYQPPSSAQSIIKKTPILVLVGPTGAGKDTLKDKLLASGHYHHIVSHTTRPPRINHGVPEEDGKEYHFIDEATFERMLKNGEFIEAKVYSGNLYGTALSEIQGAQDQTKIAMTDIEVQGVAEYKAIDPNVIAIFLLPPDFKTWQERLKRRYGDVVDVADYKLRLQTALQELDQLLTSNYFVPVVNDNLEQTTKVVENVISSQGYELQDRAAALLVAKQLSKAIQEYLDLM